MNARARVSARGSTCIVGRPFAPSPTIFEATTLEAIRKARYKPRVVDGRAVAVEGVRTRFTYLLADSSGDEPADGAPRAPGPVGDLDEHEFRARLAPVLECVERSDLSCVEVTLDKIRAMHGLTPRQAAEISRIYGFVYHRLGDYERAIRAYEAAAEASGADGGFPQAWMTVARIHYERHRYQEALDAALRYLRETESAAVADYVFVDRLRQLGAVVR